MTDLPKFEKGESIVVRGIEYRVKKVDYNHRHDVEYVRQYELESMGGPSALLYPEHPAGVFVIQEFREIEPDDIERVNDA